MRGSVGADLFSLVTRGIETDSSNKEKTKGVDEAEKMEVFGNL